MKKEIEKRPKGCNRTVSGRHLPNYRVIGYTQIQVYCEYCGIIDDVGGKGSMTAYLFPQTLEKIDDLARQLQSKDEK